MREHDDSGQSSGRSPVMRLRLWSRLKDGGFADTGIKEKKLKSQIISKFSPKQLKTGTSIC